MPQHHLQSYFMVFTRPVFSSPAFRSFWKTLPFFRRKKDIIINCEVRLTEHLEHHGFRCGAVIPYGSVEIPRSRTGWDLRLEKLAGAHNLNPTHFFWKVMIEKYRCPFLKVELLRKNPARIQDLHLVHDVLESFTGYDRTLIDEHLAGRGGKKSR
jgi:rhamnosyltransferase